MKITLYDFPAKTGVEGWESFSPFVLQTSRALRLAGLELEHEYVNMSISTASTRPRANTIY